MLVVPPCFDNQSAQPVWINCPYNSSNGLSPERLTSNTLLLLQAFNFRVTFEGRFRRRLAPGDLHSLTDRFPVLHSFKVFCILYMRKLYTVTRVTVKQGCALNRASHKCLFVRAKPSPERKRVLCQFYAECKTGTTPFFLIFRKPF